MLSFDPKVMAELLPLLADFEHSRSLSHTASISLARVQAWPWRQDRLQRCAERLAAGERAPAIHVQRYWLHGEAYYTLSDGHHRATAAKQAGHKRIRARIGGECWCMPAVHWLDAQRGSLWRETEYPGRLKLVSVGDLRPEVQEALLAVGVNRLR